MYILGDYYICVCVCVCVCITIFQSLIGAVTSNSEALTQYNGSVDSIAQWPVPNKGKIIVSPADYVLSISGVCFKGITVIPWPIPFHALQASASDTLGGETRLG